MRHVSLYMSSPSFLVVVVVTLLLCLIITQAAEKSETKESGRHKRMERLRRSFRESFRRRKDHVPESSKPHQWQSDEAAVRAGTCNFYVKVCLYLAIFLFIYFFLVIQLDLPFYGSLNMRVLLGRCSIWDASRFTSRVACPCARKRSKCSE